MNSLTMRASSKMAPSPPAALAAERILRRLFRGWTYIETRFGILQPADGVQPADLGRTFDVPDESGGLLSLRPDFTSLVAQEAATTGQGIPRPLRRSYCGTAFRKPDRGGDRRREIRQSGVELIGASGCLADAEIVTLASEGLAALGLDQAQIHLGHVGFIDALLDASNLTEAGKTIVCNLLAKHDRKAMALELESQQVDAPTATALMKLLDLVGSSAVFAQARALTSLPAALDALGELEALVNMMDRSRLPVPTIVDLTEVRDRSYYTGIRFEGFVPSSGFPVLRGGRYDNLVQPFGSKEPAVGCAFEINRISPFLEGSEPADIDELLLCPSQEQWPEVLERARALRSQGHRAAIDVLSSPSNQRMLYQEAYGIRRIIEPGTSGTLEEEGRSS
jgi:ATP phosphoribosyltransferase regulatory subunit